MPKIITSVAAIVFLSPCPVYAIPITEDGYSVENRGSWPESWPKELEGLREQSRTLVGPLVEPLAPLRHYAIPFAERGAFETAWPHLLKVKTKGAAILLRRAPSFWLDESKAGVCIHTPPAGEAPIADATKAVERRERTIYIELLVDGEIVDLNRIPLPADTSVIDERFEGVTAGIEAARDAESQTFVAGRQAQAAAGPRDLPAEQPKEPTRVNLKLSDGSRLRGETSDLQNLPLQSVLGDTLVPIEQIQSIERIPDETGRAARVRLRNGDRLTGVIGADDWHDLKLSTVLGQITVPAALLRVCEIETSMRATPVNIRASSSWEVSVPEGAFDGRRDTDWNSGNYAPAWIEADLGAAARLAEIVLVPGQDIVGVTTHEIWISAEPIGDDRTKARLVHTFHGETANHQRLVFEFPDEVTARYVQVRTTQSPTWISWYEVEIRVEPAAADHCQTAPRQPEPIVDSRGRIRALP